MSEGGEEELDPLVIRMSGAGGSTPAVFIQLDVIGLSQIIRAILRPDLPLSVIAAQWAEALELSAGAGAVAQLATRDDAEAELWGPAELITPEVERNLDDQIDDDGLGGFLLGHDFLLSVSVTYIGPARVLLVLPQQSSPEEE